MVLELLVKLRIYTHATDRSSTNSLRFSLFVLLSSIEQVYKCSCSNHVLRIASSSQSFNGGNQFGSVVEQTQRSPDRQIDFRMQSN